MTPYHFGKKWFRNKESRSESIWISKENGFQSGKGFTLLLAALISSVVLSLGIAIWGIASKQVTLSSMGRDSQFAFYTADTAAECALYWDYRHQYFGTSTPEGLDVGAVKCGGKCLRDDNADGTCEDVGGRPASGPTFEKYTMPFAVDLFDKYCAKVEVRKCNGTLNSDGTCPTSPDHTVIRTIIHADGYNVKCDAIFNPDGTPKSSINLRALQRSVELHY